MPRVKNKAQYPRYNKRLAEDFLGDPKPVKKNPFKKKKLKAVFKGFKHKPKGLKDTYKGTKMASTASEFFKQ
jgi:hypothetical protein